MRAIRIALHRMRAVCHILCGFVGAIGRALRCVVRDLW
jgi:hypothetical protein